MKIPALKGHVDPTEISPERLAGNPALSKDQKIAEASRQFEVILLKQVLEASQKTVIHSAYSDDSMASGIYHDMITNQLAESISKSGKFGIAKLFEQQLETHKHLQTENAAPRQAASHAEISRRHATSAADRAAAQILKPLHEPCSSGRESAPSNQSRLTSAAAVHGIQYSTFSAKTPP